MGLELTKIKYHRENEAINLTEAQALTMVSDVINTALAQSGVTAEIKVTDKK